MIGWVRAALVLSTLLFVPGLREDFETPKTAAVRVCGLAAVASALASWRVLRDLRWTALDVAVPAWLAVEALATTFSSAPLLSLLGEPVQREGLATSLAIAGLYFAARVGTRDARAAWRTLGFALAAGAVASAYALLQAAGRDPIPWQPAMVGGYPTAVGRPFGTLGHPNLLGVVSASTGAACLAAVWSGASRGRGRVAASTAALLVCAIATAVTLSRAAWLGLAAGAVTGLVALAAMRSVGLSRRALWIGAGLAGVTVIALVGLGWGPRIAARFGDLLHPTKGSGAPRLEIWRSALAAWQARPWLGWGPDTFAMVFPRFQTPEFWRHEWAALPLHAHSILIHTLATRGAAGLLAGMGWGWGIVAAARAAYRRAPDDAPAIAAALAIPAAIVVAGGAGAVGVTGHALVAVASGTLAALAAPRSDDRDRPGLSAPAIVACAAAALWASADLASSRLVATAESGLHRAWSVPAGAGGDLRDRSLAAVRRASKLAPFDDFASRVAVDLLLQDAERGASPGPRLLEATGEARRGLWLVEPRAENHAQLARVLAYRAAMGDQASFAEAQAEIAVTSRLAPSNAMILGECARLELLLGRPDLGLPLARRSVALYPDDGASLLMLARVLVAVGEGREAIAVLERAVRGEWRGEVAGRAEARAALAEIIQGRP